MFQKRAKRIGMFYVVLEDLLNVIYYKEIRDTKRLTKP